MRKSLQAYSRWSRLRRQSDSFSKLRAVTAKQLPVMRLITDMDFKVIKSCSVFEKVFLPNMTSSPNLLQFLTEDDSEQAALAHRFRQQLNAIGKIQQRLSLKDCSGHAIDMSCQAECIQQAEPHLIWRFETVNLKLDDQELAALTAQVYERAGAAMLIMDERLTIVSINNAFTKATGFTIQHLQGKSLSKLCDVNKNPELLQDILQKMTDASAFSREILLNKNDGSHFPVYVIVNVLERMNAKPHYYLWVVFDISEQKQLESELRVSAEIDPLTQLGNRKLLFQNLESAIISAKRFNYDIALLFLDLDGFKQVNDHFGHGEGDKVLLEVAQRLRRCVRQVDTVARLGGDEFVVILNGTSKELIAVTAQRIIDFLTLNVKDQAVELQVSASIGIAMYPQDSCSPLILLKYADKAMYKAKAKGKRQFCWHLDTES